MSLKRISSVLAGVAAIFILSSSTGGRAAVFNEDRTGSPLAVGGGSFCSSCHNGASFNATISVQIIDQSGNPATTYKPDSVYNVLLNVLDITNSASGFGVQAVMLNSSNAQAGTFSNPIAAKISNVSSRQYIEHNGLSPAGAWSVSWTAPAAGTGDVTLYAAGAAVNGNGGSSGDKSVKHAPVVLSEATSVSADQSLEAKLGLYPNPATDNAIVSWQGIGGELNLDLFNIAGNQVFSTNIEPSFTGSYRLETGNFKPGIYLLRLSNDSGISFVQKLVVKP